jgi:hypothetical protein
MAYNSKRDCISIEEAKKDESYYYDYNLINEFVLRQGDKNRHHFALKSGSKACGEGGESDIHRDCKMWLVKTKEFNYNGILIKAHSVKYEEATIKDSKRIPDVTFYDEQGNIICIIEVVNTNAISIEKEKELKERNILTFEAIIKDGSYKEFESIRYFGNEQIDKKRRESYKSFESRLHKSESLSSKGVREFNIKTKKEREGSYFRSSKYREGSQIRMEREIEKTNGFQNELDTVQEDTEREVHESSMESFRMERESTNKRINDLTERANRLRFELQRKEDLLSREADEESNARLGERATNLREGIERKQHEVYLSENRIKSVGIKLEEIKNERSI